MGPRLAVALGLAASVWLTWEARSHSQAPSFDLVIRGGRVVDGTGNP